MAKQPKPKKDKRHMKKMLIRALEAVVGFPAAVARKVRTLGYSVVLAANAFTPSTHKKTITKFTGTAIATRYLLAKSDGTQTGITICGAGDRAMFCVMDTAGTTELALTNPAPVSCIMLGVTDETVPMIASAGGINPGDVVYPAANGQVSKYPGNGTNYPCGMVVANGSAQAGDILEVMAVLEFQAATI